MKQTKFKSLATTNYDDKKLKMKEAAGEIIGRIKVGALVSKEDKQFLESWLAMFGGKAGNAGKRKSQKTGK